jgi:A/G-specific adenine glycosylase
MASHNVGPLAYDVHMQDRMALFQEMIWDFYHANGRDLDWRYDPTPYQVLISEVMLQQTQVARVQVKYAEWMALFPTLDAVANASVAEITRAWQGLGYNRRGLWLKRSAEMVMHDFAGIVPNDPDQLRSLPGIGANTAGSIAAFAYNAPVVFIETNIRRVFIHEFMAEEADVSDSQLLPIIEGALDRENPREWYYALMDYGADLARRIPNPNRRSKHHAKQSTFEGSIRQVRGRILRELLASPMSDAQLQAIDDRAIDLATKLAAEGFLCRENYLWRLK